MVTPKEMQSSLVEYAPIYCEGATLAVLERAEFTGLAVHDFREELAAYLESQKETFYHESEQSETGPSTDFPSVDMNNVEAKLGEVTGLIDNAQSLTMEGQYYEAAKSLESANSILLQLSSEVYSS